MRAAATLLAGAFASLAGTATAVAMPLRGPAAAAATSIVVSIPLPRAGTFAVKNVGVRVQAKVAKQLPKVLWLRLCNDEELPGVTVLADIGRGKPKGKTVRFTVRIAVGREPAAGTRATLGSQAAEIEIGSTAPNGLFRDPAVRRAIAYGWARVTLPGLTRPVPWDDAGYLAGGLGLPATPFDPERAAALLEEAGWTLGEDGVRYDVELIRSGGENPRVNALALDGTAVGSFGPNGARQPFVFADGNVILLPRPPFCTSCIAQGISVDGSTVVGNCPGGGYAWSWTQAGGLVVLGPGNAYGVAGNTIVGSSGDLAGVWLNGVFTPLPAAVNPSAAFAVSDDGEWIGGFNQSLAARWRVSEDGLSYEYVPGDATPGVSRAWFDVNSLGDAAGTEARSQSTSAPFLLVNGVPFPVFIPPEKQQGETNAVNTWGLAGGRFADVLPLDLGEQAFIAPSAAFLPPVGRGTQSRPWTS